MAWTAKAKPNLTVTEIDAEFMDGASITFMDGTNMVFREAASNSWTAKVKPT